MRTLRTEKIPTIDELIIAVNAHRKEEPFIAQGENDYILTWKEKQTEAEFYMEVLHSLQSDVQTGTELSLTLEEQNAIDYAISSIKTLIDMGVIDSDNK